MKPPLQWGIVLANPESLLVPLIVEPALEGELAILVYCSKDAVARLIDLVCNDALLYLRWVRVESLTKVREVLNDSRLIGHSILSPPFVRIIRNYSEVLAFAFDLFSSLF